jgi:biopolymer transport protein ExbB/TolQ
MQKFQQLIAATTEYDPNLLLPSLARAAATTTTSLMLAAPTFFFG